MWFVVVGGVGSLFVDLEKIMFLMSIEGFLVVYYLMVLNMGKGLKEFEKLIINWIYLSLVVFFDVEGVCMGVY